MMKLNEALNQPLFHVTRKKNVPSIRKKGIIPKVPVDMADQKAVYLFIDKKSLEDAVMNWLGDRFDEEEELVILTINPDGLNIHPSDASYEVMTFEVIPPQAIINVESI